MISIYLIVAIICAILLAITAAFADFGGDMDAGGGVDLHVDTGADMDLGMDTDVDAGFGHGDFHGAGISPLSIPVVLVFGTLFGATGTVFEGLNYNAYLVPIIAVIVATVLSAIVYVLLVRVFVKTQATTRVDMRALVGREGETTMPIKVGSSGQILVITEERGRTLLPAVSDADIPTNTVVEILGVVGNEVKVRQKM